MQKKTENIILGKIPPQFIEAEQAILGAMLLEREALIQAASEIKSAFFYKEAHKVIAEAIISLFRSGENVDLLTVQHELRKMNKLEDAGGSVYLVDLCSRIASGAHIIQHIRIVQEAFLKRELIRMASDIQQKAYDNSEDVFELMDQSQLYLINLMSGLSSHQAISLKDSAYQVFQEMSKNMARRQNNEFTGIPTPIDSLNQYTGGWQNGDLIILAARPAMGKTGLALAFARAAAKAGNGVLFFSLEMPHQKLTYRLIAQETKKKSVTEMQRGDLSDAELHSMTMATSRMTKYQIHIDDQASTSLMQLRSKANRMKSKGDLKMIIVDYLQLMQDESKQQGNREQEISRISRGLKILAKDLNVPVIALSQLSRAVETRGGDKKPQLSDLRESGAIEQDADMVIFLYRPEYYGITEMEYPDLGLIDTKGLAIGSIAKHRNGGLGDFRMTFDAKHVDFMNYDSTPQYQDYQKFNYSQEEKNLF